MRIFFILMLFLCVCSGVFAQELTVDQKLDNIYKNAEAAIDEIVADIEGK